MIIESLETLIGRNGLESVVRTLESICYGKAEQAAANWQDGNLAREWERAGVLTGGCADALSTSSPGISSARTLTSFTSSPTNFPRPVTSKPEIQ